MLVSLVALCLAAQVVAVDAQVGEQSRCAPLVAQADVDEPPPGTQAAWDGPQLTPEAEA
jgi:hypothetical protein